MLTDVTLEFGGAAIMYCNLRYVRGSYPKFNVSVLCPKK
jgi:hypothetical protein